MHFPVTPAVFSKLKLFVQMLVEQLFVFEPPDSQPDDMNHAKLNIFPKKALPQAAFLGETAHKLPRHPTRRQVPGVFW